MNAADAAARVAELLSRDEAALAAGIALGSVETGRVELRMPTRRDMGNGHAIVHGGWLFLLADTAFAYVVASGDETGVTIAADITFHAPTRVGDEVSAVAVLEHRSGATVLVDVIVTGASGERVASSRITGRVLRDSA
jgi:acyl-CoA thioesterase